MRYRGKLAVTQLKNETVDFKSIDSTADIAILMHKNEVLAN
jgi:hypothetical protein